MLNDEEIASVLTYIRNSFGNKSPAIEPTSVAIIRKELKGFYGLYSPEKLISEHPIEKN
jgi:hypothetical protein